MTIRSLFTILLKILGIFFIRDILIAITQAISLVVYFITSGYSSEMVLSFAIALLMFLIYAFIAFFLIFKSNIIIDTLKLDKGFDQETFPLNIHRSTILSIAIIVIGGIILAGEIPNFCQQLFSYFQEKRLTFGMTNPTTAYFITTAVKILIGFFLITAQRPIVNFIERQRKK